MSVKVDRAQFMDQGYLIFRNLISPERIERLRSVHEKVVDRQRVRWAAQRGPEDPPGGQWDTNPQPRVLANEPGLIDASTAEAIEFWLDDQLLEIANTLLAVPEASVTEFFLMCNPTRADFGPSNWHRDIHAAHMAPLQHLIDDVVENGPRYVQWNIPLFDDDVLWVVPGSHRRTFGENDFKWSVWNVKEPLPGSIPVDLRAGDAVVYINYILHWGSKYNRKIRRTIHGGHSCFTSHRSEPFLPHLSPRGQRHFAEAELRTHRAEALTELALRAAMQRDSAAFEAALGAVQPKIGPRGKLLLSIYLDKIASDIRHQHRRDVPETEWEQHFIGRLHPISLRWGRQFADRFSPEEADTLWERFAEFDALLRGEGTHPHADRQDGYLFMDVPGLSLSSLTGKWSPAAVTG